MVGWQLINDRVDVHGYSPFVVIYIISLQGSSNSSHKITFYITLWGRKIVLKCHTNLVEVSQDKSSSDLGIYCAKSMAILCSIHTVTGVKAGSLLQHKHKHKHKHKYKEGYVWTTATQAQEQG